MGGSFYYYILKVEQRKNTNSVIFPILTRISFSYVWISNTNSYKDSSSERTNNKNFCSFIHNASLHHHEAIKSITPTEKIYIYKRKKEGKKLWNFGENGLTWPFLWQGVRTYSSDHINQVLGFSALMSKISTSQIHKLLGGVRWPW